MAGMSKKLQSPRSNLFSAVYVKGNLVCKPAKSQQTVAGWRLDQCLRVSVCNYLVTGLRQFHESGPELKRTISGHLNEILDPVEPGTRRRNHPFFGGGDDSHSRRNIAFFAGAGPAIVQVRWKHKLCDLKLFLWPVCQRQCWSNSLATCKEGPAKLCGTCRLSAIKTQKGNQELTFLSEQLQKPSATFAQMP